jgi:RNA polymerase sigma factor (sigma-70 family)
VHLGNVPLSNDSDSHGADSRPTIVIVEMDDALARVRVQALECKGYHVNAVANVAETANLIARVNPSLIIVDVMSPDNLLESGVDSKQLKSVPVLVLSNGVNRESRHRAIHAGADAFLVKPVSDQRELYDLVGALLRRNDATARLVDEDPLEPVFRGLARDYESHIERMVHRYRGADELVDEVLLVTWKRLPAHVVFDDRVQLFRMDWPEPDIKAWLAKTAKNICRSAARANVRYASLLTTYEHRLVAGRETLGPHLSAEEKTDLRDYIAAALRMLPDRDRALVEDRYYRDLTPEQIAAKYGIAVKTVKNIVSACLKDVRLALKREERSAR